MRLAFLHSGKQSNIPEMVTLEHGCRLSPRVRRRHVGCNLGSGRLGTNYCGVVCRPTCACIYNNTVLMESDAYW